MNNLSIDALLAHDDKIANGMAYLKMEEREITPSGNTDADEFIEKHNQEKLAAEAVTFTVGKMEDGK